MKHGICLLMLAACLVVGIGDSVSAQDVAIRGPNNAADPNSHIDFIYGRPAAGTIYIAQCQEVVLNNPMMPGHDPAFGAFRPVPGAGIISGALANGFKNGMPVSMATLDVRKGPGKLYAVEVYSNNGIVSNYFYPTSPTAVSKLTAMNPCLALPVP